MSKIIDAIGRDKINRFTLAFKDAEMEKEFLDEFNKNLIRLLAWGDAIIAIILLCGSLFFIFYASEGFLFIHRMIILAFGIVAFLAVFIWIYFPPTPRLTQLIIIAWFLFQITYISYLSFILTTGYEWWGMINIITAMFLAGAIPCRFLFSMPFYFLVQCRNPGP